MGQQESSIHAEDPDIELESETTIDSTQSMQHSSAYYADKLSTRCENIDFDVEAWYKIIHNETFHTEFLPISPDIAQAFINFYRARYTSRKPLNNNDIQLISSVRDQLRKIFSSEKNQFSRNGAFVRLSSRSPKDGMPLNYRNIPTFYDRKVNELQRQYPDEWESVEGRANLQMIAIGYAQFQSLKVTDEVQALNLILSSERVFADLYSVLDCQQAKENPTTNVNNIKLYDWNQNIIIRQWNDSLDPSMEFRCFVHQSTLTAISQYDHRCKYNHLQNEIVVQQIKATLIKYWQESIKPLFEPLQEQYRNYVIDIGLIENKQTNEYDCIVIELNPFQTSTGGSLFHWKEDSDQLHGRGTETELRVRTNYSPYLTDYVEYLLEVNQCDGKQNPSEEHSGREPYFVFLEQIKTRLSLW